MANIDIAGKLNAATAEGYIAEANQIHYAGGNGNVEDALKSMKTSVDDLNKNGRNCYRYGAVRASQLFALTTSASSEDIKAALTDIAGNHPKQAGLDACITGRMRLAEYVMGGTVMVGWSGQGYILTYVGQLTPAPDVYACTITVSATDADGATTYAVVKSGTRVKVTEGAKLPDDVVNAQHYRFAGIEESVTAFDAVAQTPRALYYDKTAMTFVCLDQDGNYYKQWPEEFAPMAAYVTEFGEEPVAGKLFWSEDEEAFYYYSAAEWYKVEDDSVRNDVAKVSDTLSEYMSAGHLTAPFPRATAEASGSFAAVGGNAALKDGEIIPWTGWLTLVLCYQTSDTAAKVKLTGYAGQTLGKCELIGETAVAATEEPKVVRITGEHDYNPRRNGSPDACMAGSDYYVNVEVKSPNAGFTMLWAVVYESDEYGNPRRRGGSERERLCACQGVQIQNTFENDNNVRTPVVYNERTGWFEMNGLTNISLKDMRAIANCGGVDNISAQVKNTSVFYQGLRTNPFSQGFSSQNALNNSSFSDIEVLHLNNSIALPQSGWMSSDCEVIAIIGYFNLGYAQQFDQRDAFGVQTTLESVKLRSLKQSFTLNIKMLSWDSLNYLITNAANTAAITITVHADVYAKMTGGTVDNWGSLGTLAEEKGVKLVAYGEAGYPFLTRVLWHGYKRLENKINAAKSGDTIYIHPDDRRKITAAQKDDWAALVTAGAEKQISFALPAE